MDRITLLKNENFIWFIYFLFAIFGIRANNLEIEDIKNNNTHNQDEYKNINIIIFFISIFIYGYFIYVSYLKYKSQKNINTTLVLIGAILIFISCLLFIYVELNSNDIVPNEV